MRFEDACVVSKTLDPIFCHDTVLVPFFLKIFDNPVNFSRVFVIRFYSSVGDRVLLVVLSIEFFLLRRVLFHQDLGNFLASEEGFIARTNFPPNQILFMLEIF